MAADLSQFVLGTSVEAKHEPAVQPALTPEGGLVCALSAAESTASRLMGLCTGRVHMREEAGRYIFLLKSDAITTVGEHMCAASATSTNDRGK